MPCASCTNEALAFNDVTVTSDTLPIRGRRGVALRESLARTHPSHMSNSL